MKTEKQTQASDGCPDCQKLLNRINTMNKLRRQDDVDARELLRDESRLDWLLRNISGAEYRRLGIEYAANCQRADIDRAMSQALHNAPLLLNLLDAAVATLQNNLHLCDGENCTLYALRKAVEAIDPDWEAQ